MTDEYPGLSRYPVYMDHHATTPMDRRVLEVMLPYFTEVFGNPASIDHIYGAEAKLAIDHARQQIATVINADPEEIVFTSGATEADNLAILGVAERYAEKGNHIITCVTEHKAVLDTCAYLEQKGYSVTYLSVDHYGLVDPDDVRRAITPRTILITIMTANNEIGTIAPIAEIGQIAHEHEVLFHTDATQAVSYIPIDVETMNVDLLSMSGHKVYGPKGVGALYVRKRHPHVWLVPQIHGGGHERGMRSGTLNVPGIVGLGKAIEISWQEMRTESQRLKELRDQLWNGLQASIINIQLNGHPIERLPHNLNMAVPRVENRSLVVKLKQDIAFSIGSACSTTTVEPSHVLLALDPSVERAHHSIRLGLGRETNSCDIQFVLDCLKKAIIFLQKF